MKRQPNKEKAPMLKQTALRLDPDLLRKAKIAAVEHDTTLQQFIADAIKAYLAKGGKR